VFAAVFFILGYFRNFIFLSINNRASALYYNEPSFVLSGILSFFNQFSYKDLITLKWILTFLFSVFFTLLSLATVSTLFHNQQYNSLCLILNIFVIVISVIFIFSGRFIASFSNSGFVISRSLIHLEQSPIITLIMVMAIYYHNKQR
jgi:hypothetical protein